MYDEVRISTQSEILEVIPRKYYTNHSIYKDQSVPSILNFNFTQNQDQIKVNLYATDNNAVYKIRVVFSQNFGWRIQTLYPSNNQEEYTIILTDFRNIDSIVYIFLEVYDIYGNIATTILKSMKFIAIEIVPYLIIGIILGFSVGLASISSILYRKYDFKRQQKEERETKVSFLDDLEEKS
jgi:hypothetical protein